MAENNNNMNTNDFFMQPQEKTSSKNHKYNI